MHQKLKSLRIVSASLLLTLGGILSIGIGTHQAFADSMTVEFDCQDGSTAYTAKDDTKNHDKVVTCSSGVLMDYINIDTTGNQPIAIKATCPGSEVVDPEVDTPNQPTTKYRLFCETVSGSGDKQTATKTSHIPDVADTQAVNVKCPDGSTPKNNDINTCPAPSQTDPALKKGNCSDISHCDLINNYVDPFINFLAALVGVASVFSYIVAGIQYGSSAGDSAKITMAKNRIRNTTIALVTFIFLYALLNFLVPGGLF